MTTIYLTVCDANPRESTLRSIALTAGIALVRWAHRRPAALTHEQQAQRLAAQQAAGEQRDRAARYGFVS
ncbi:MAG: hypothetical protein RL499_791 [Actinomycetota bacterium]|jgi:hypothetical protein